MQLTPLFEEPLDVPAAWLSPIKAAVLLSIALVQLVNTRSLVQSYLNSGLRQWHDMKHGPPAGAAGTKTGEAITLRLRIVNMLLVKVSRCVFAASCTVGRWLCDDCICLGLLAQQTRLWHDPV